MVSQVILVMAEYSVDDSPLWFRLSHDDIGLADAVELGLSAGLRRDLEVWNDTFDAIAGSGSRFPSAEIHDHHRAEASTSRLESKTNSAERPTSGAVPEKASTCSLT